MNTHERARARAHTLTNSKKRYKAHLNDHCEANKSKPICHVPVASEPKCETL